MRVFNIILLAVYAIVLAYFTGITAEYWVLLVYTLIIAICNFIEGYIKND
jgi:hypothetical protein